MSQQPHTNLVDRLTAVLRPSGDGSLSHRIVDHVWEDVIEGVLETGARLPTARQLAVGLGVSPRIVERAYSALERLGVVSVRPGEGTFVSLNAPDADVRERYQKLEEIAREAVRDAEALGFTRFDLRETVTELPIDVDSESEAS